MINRQVLNYMKEVGYKERETRDKTIAINSLYSLPSVSPLGQYYVV